MLITPSFARDLKRGEEPLVDELITAAFGRDDEVQLIQRLRKTRVVAGEQVMPMGDRIVGYYALSYMIKPKGWLCLAPVAIAPDVQRRGYGKRMLGMLTEWARLTGTSVVIKGPQEFCDKAGFSRGAAAKLRSPFPNENLAISGVKGVPDQELIYPVAFLGG